MAEGEQGRVDAVFQLHAVADEVQAKASALALIEVGDLGDGDDHVSPSLG